MKNKWWICMTIIISVSAVILVASGHSPYGLFITHSGNASAPILFKPASVGSKDYVNKMNSYVKKYGPKQAIYKVMQDVAGKGGSLESWDPSDRERLYKLFSNLVYRHGSVDMKIHYFRNRLNFAPATLRDLIGQNAKLPPQQRWRLLPVKSSLYHMQGADGIYNLKFVSGDGFCEAVYSKAGTLLTAKNDPVNMGTFNYAAGIHVRGSHQKFDVDPYLKWGNTPDSPQKGKANIAEGIRKCWKLYNENADKVIPYRYHMTGNKGI